MKFSRIHPAGIRCGGLATGRSVGVYRQVRSWLKNLVIAVLATVKAVAREIKRVVFRVTAAG
jgi:hypothetical protein